MRNVLVMRGWAEERERERQRGTETKNQLFWFASLKITFPNVCSSILVFVQQADIC